MCKVLKVSRSSYYLWCNSEHVIKHSELRTEIVKIQKTAEGTYGYRRILEKLNYDGIQVGKKLVIKLIKEEGIQCKVKRTKPYAGYRTKEIEPYLNKLNRNFVVEKINQVWVTDITYIWTKSGWVYLAVIIDLYSRKAVGWSVSKNPDTNLVLQALYNAVKTRKPKSGLMIHSDQGCQYTSKKWCNTLESFGFEISMSGRGQCWDNAPMESWNATLKRESDVVRKVKNDIEEVNNVLFKWIEGWYNSRRLHSTIGYRSPADFEKRAA